MTEIYKGTIIKFEGSWRSGLATLYIKRDDGIEHTVYCENAATVRTLDGAFGNVIGEDHTVNEEGGHIGQEIYYFIEGGILSSFIPVDEATPEIVEMYEKQKQGRK